MWHSKVLVLLAGLQLPYLEARLRASNQHQRHLSQEDQPLSTKLACFFKDVVDLKSISLVSNPEINFFTSVLQPYGQLHHLSGSTCAVVSSSGVLQRFQHGPWIDQADTVIRFNDAPVAGYEALVGHKDMLRFVNMHFAKSALKGEAQVNPGTTYINILPSPSTHQSFVELAQAQPNIAFYRGVEAIMQKVNERMRQAFHREWFSVGSQGYRELPTTGALGMFVALSFCREVWAFGMASSSWTSGFFPYHYYEKGGFANDNPVHKSFDAEKELWRLMAKNMTLVDAMDVAVIPGFSSAQCPPAPA